MKITIKLLTLLILGSLIFQACEKDDNGDVTFLEEGVLVINEGNFSQGNASVTYYNSNDNTVHQDLFSSTNGRPLGDVGQSMTISGDNGYIVVNNSAKIEVVDMTTFESKGTISGLTSPLFLLVINAAKAYVTDLVTNQISIIDLNTNTVSGKITTAGETHGLLMADNKVFVTNPGSDQVLIIDPVADTVMTKVSVPAGASDITKDANGNLWVLCTGNFQDGQPRHLVQMTTSGQILQTLPINDPDAFITDLTVSNDGMSLYYLKSDVYKLSITDNQVPTTPFITAGDRSLYSIGIEPGTNNIYVSNAVDFSTKGWALRYDNSGTVVDSFQTGLIPGAFAFL